MYSWARNHFVQMKNGFRFYFRLFLIFLLCAINEFSINIQLKYAAWKRKAWIINDSAAHLVPMVPVSRCPVHNTVKILATIVEYNTNDYTKRLKGSVSLRSLCRSTHILWRPISNEMPFSLSCNVNIHARICFERQAFIGIDKDRNRKIKMRWGHPRNENCYVHGHSKMAGLWYGPNTTINQ